MLSRLGQAVNATKKKRVCFVDFSACSRGNKPNRQPFTIDKIDRPPSTDDKTDRQFSFSTTGKSTLLRALAVGVYDKVPGDGREFVVADPGAVTVRAEDGRSVSGVDISPFICSLPTSATAGAAAVAAAVGTAKAAAAKAKKEANAAKAAAAFGAAKKSETDSTADAARAAVAAVEVAEAALVAAMETSRTGAVARSNGQQEKASGDTPRDGDGDGCCGSAVSTECFSTQGASGSTSQAANVVEALEAGAKALLLDEDTCAGNVRRAF